MAFGRVAIYGGKGALGSICVNHFKSSDWWVANIDFKPHDQADVNIVVPSNGPWAVQEHYVTKQLGTKLNNGSFKLDGIICVTNGWVGGNAINNLSEQVEQTWKSSIWTSTIATTLATKYLKPDGALVFSGSKAALRGTPKMIGFGMAKAAVHQLTKSLACENSGLPTNAFVVAILPELMDNATQIKWMSEEDVNFWTPLGFIAGLFEKWVSGRDRPPNGSLVLLDAEKEDNKVSPTPKLTILEE